MKREFPIIIHLQAFLLRSDIPPEGKYLYDRKSEPIDSKLKEPLHTTAMDAGLTKMRRPSIVSYTLPSLEATEYAKEEGKQEQFQKACYKSYWEESQDIGNLKVLKDIAINCGLDWDQLESRLKSKFYRDKILNQYKAALEIGFRGVPAFVIGNNGFTGAVPYHVFKQMAQEAMDPST